VLRRLFLPPVVELGHSRAVMPGEVLHVVELHAVAQLIVDRLRSQSVGPTCYIQRAAERNSGRSLFSALIPSASRLARISRSGLPPFSWNRSTQHVSSCWKSRGRSLTTAPSQRRHRPEWPPWPSTRPGEFFVLVARPLIQFVEQTPSRRETRHLTR